MLEKATREGVNRRLAYLLAVWSGLRRSELAALTWGDVDLDVLPAKIRLRAETTKSKRADSIALHPQVVDARQTPAKIVYRKDMTEFGWPLDPAIRDQLRSGNGLQAINGSGARSSTGG